MTTLPAAEERASAAPASPQGLLAGDWPSILDAPPATCLAGEGRCGADEHPVGYLPRDPEELDAWLDHRRGWPYLEIRCSNGHHRYVRLPVPPRADRFDAWSEAVIERRRGSSEARYEARAKARAKAEAERKARKGEDQRFYWTPERIAKLEVLWAAGVPYAALALEFNRRVSSMPGRISKLRAAGHAFPIRASDGWGGNRSARATQNKGRNGAWAR